MNNIFLPNSSDMTHALNDNAAAFAAVKKVDNDN
jgi:hypothetical protein